MKLPRGFASLWSLLDKWRARRLVRRALPHAEALVQAYGRALVEAAESGSLVTNVKYLPAPMDALKTALLLAMHAESDPWQISMMKVGYLSLSTFQPGVGDVRVTLQPPSIPDDPMELARAILEREPEYTRWLDVMRQEDEQLAGELACAGF